MAACDVLVAAIPQTGIYLSELTGMRYRGKVHEVFGGGRYRRKLDWKIVILTPLDASAMLSEGEILVLEETR